MKKSHWLSIGLISAFLSFFPLVHALMIQPLYEAGKLDSLATFCGRISAMLVLPGHVFTASFIPLPPAKHFTFTGIIIACFIDLIFYGGIITLLFRLVVKGRKQRDLFPKAPVKNPPHESGNSSTATNDTPDNPARRKFLIVTGSAAGAGLLAATYPVLVAPGKLTVRQLTIPIKGLPDSLAGLKMVHLTDIHHDEWIPRSHVRKTVELTNWLKPDIVVLTGDYVTSNAAFIHGVAAELGRLKAPLGTFGCLGNHDFWADPAETRRQFAANDLQLIDSNRVFITPDCSIRKDADSGLCLGAVGDLWEDVVDPELTFHNVKPEIPRILMSHNPDVVEKSEIASGHVRVDLMLSGHTHGGQVRLPNGKTPIVPSNYGSRYVQGLVQGPGCPINISAGIGLAMLPVRFNVSPEIVLITLTPA